MKFIPQNKDTVLIVICNGRHLNLNRLQPLVESVRNNTSDIDYQIVVVLSNTYEENKKYLQVIPLSRGTEKKLRQLYAARRQISELRKKYPERAVQYAQQEMEIQDDIDEVINNFNKNYDRIVGKTK